MSGIAGILRRDGRLIPEKWVNWLEHALACRGPSGTWRIEDSVDIESGTLELLLLQQGSEPRPDSLMVIDGEMGGECAAAIWDKETLELELLRCGIGQKPLYMLDLQEAGDGVIFCSVPTPLTKIADELELSGHHLLHGVQQYLQLGFITAEQSLLSPVQPVPVQLNSQEVHCTQPQGDIDVSPSPAEDLISLVSHLGLPTADALLLSRLWLYRGARQYTNQFHDGLLDSSNRVQRTQSLSRWHQLLSHVPMQPEAKKWAKFGVTSVHAVFDVPTIERLTEHEYTKPFCPHYSGSIEEQLEQFDNACRVPDGVMRGMDAAANAAGVELYINPTEKQVELQQYPLAKWFKSPQSSLGQLLGDTLTSSNVFDGLPINKDEVSSMYDLHQRELADYSSELFTLLTLALWRQRVLAL